MKTWEEFVKYNHATEIEFKAIYYGLKEQGILEEFLEEWNGRWELGRYPWKVLDICLLWSATRKGHTFWGEQNETFMKNFERYKGVCLKRPSIFREPKCGTE